jgi:hypothetical protein
MPEKSRNFELLEPASPEALVPDSLIEPWMIAAAAVVIVILAFLIFRKKKSTPLDPLAIRRTALADAAAALDKIDETPARDAAVRSSLVLRKYLAVVTGDPALFETHEETVSRHDALKDFSDEARAAAGTEFSRLAALKYAAGIPDVSARDVVATSRALLHSLHQGFRS